MKKNSTKMSKKKKIILVIISIILILAIVSIPLIMYLNFILRYNSKEYKEYENKMTIYGLNNLYNNSKTKSTEKVTNIEVLKMVLGATLNITDIKEYIGVIPYIDGEELTEDNLWLEQLYNKKILNKSETDENSLQEKAT